MNRVAKDLPRSAPQAQGVCAPSITRFIKALDNTEATMRGFVLLRHGKLVAEKYWEPYGPQDKNLVYSISKSFTSTAVGLLYDEGRLDLQTPVLDFFPQETPEQPNENLKAMRVRDLLSMNTGHDTDPSVQMLLSSDWVKTMLHTPITHQPGTHFVYNTGASYLLSVIVQKITGETVLEYLRPRLFDRLGFGDVDGDRCGKGYFTGGWGLFVRLEDLAKLGLLYLNGGEYAGKRILSGEWVDMAVAVQSDNATGREGESPDWRQGYGFQFWRCRHGCFRADGAMGQFCIMLPEQDAVLAIMSEMNDMQKILDIVWDILLPAMRGCSSQTEKGIQNRACKLDKFADQDSVRFSFAQDALTFSMMQDGESCSIQSGRGAWLEGISTLPIGERSFIPLFHAAHMPVPVSSYFMWTEENILELHWVYRETPHRACLECRFNGDEVSFTLHSSLGDPKNADEADFTGRMQPVCNP